MNNLSSAQLKLIQDILDLSIKEEIENVQCDYERISMIACINEIVDRNRRLKWNDEHFGVYDKIASEIFDENDNIKADFDSDDIPF